jgi:hypothetical protein
VTIVMYDEIYKTKAIQNFFRNILRSLIDNLLLLRLLL